MRRSIAVLGLLMLAVPTQGAVRVKDLARVDGVRRNQLLGYGLVVGLNGTGDKDLDFTMQATANLLDRLGVSVPASTIKVKNVAAVVVTADLPPFSRAGQRVDVMVSSMGDAKSLQGGTLLLTPLKAPNGQVFAVGQGAVLVGGFVAGAAGSGTQKNHPTVGRIPGGAILERDAPLPKLEEDGLVLVLSNPDYTTSSRMAAALNRALGEGMAVSVDAGRVRVTLPQEAGANLVDFLARLEGVTVEPDMVARVVLNEKTGTVVLGQEVKVRPVAISHGNLTVQVSRYLDVSQPEPFARRGRTVARDQADVQTEEGTANVVLLDKGESLASLVQALNALGVSPRDLVTVFQTLEAAGALEAELEIL